MRGMRTASRSRRNTGLVSSIPQLVTEKESIKFVDICVSSMNKCERSDGSIERLVLYKFGNMEDRLRVLYMAMKANSSKVRLRLSSMGRGLEKLLRLTSHDYQRLTFYSKYPSLLLRN